MDDIQYNRHVEMTLRKVGFEVESINNEFSLNEPLLSFNPDYIVCRGNSQRLNVLNVAKKLKESGTRYNGKVILVLAEEFVVPPDEIFKLKADLILHDPISTLRLVVQLIGLTTNDIEFIKDKLLKFAITDNQFRNFESQILRNAGTTIDSEIQIVSEMDGQTAESSGLIIQKGVEPADYGTVVQKGGPSEDSGMVIVSQDVIKKLGEELNGLNNELPLRIDSYNRAIKKVDQDLKKGHKKRQTKKELNQLHKDLMTEKKTDKKSEQEQDNERIRYTQALFNRKKGE